MCSIIQVETNKNILWINQYLFICSQVLFVLLFHFVASTNFGNHHPFWGPFPSNEKHQQVIHNYFIPQHTILHKVQTYFFSSHHTQVPFPSSFTLTSNSLNDLPCLDLDSLPFNRELLSVQQFRFSVFDIPFLSPRCFFNLFQLFSEFLLYHLFKFTHL